MIILTALAALAFGTGPAADRPPGEVTERILIRYQAAADLANAILVPQAQVVGGAVTISLVPEGIDALGPRAEDNSLEVTGTREGIANLRALVKLLDIKSRALILRFRVIQRSQTAAGQVTVRRVNEPSITTLNNSTATLSMMGGGAEFRMAVLPRLNGDGSISVRLEVSHKARVDAAPITATFNNRVEAGKWVRIGGLTDSSVAEVQASAKGGRDPRSPGAYTVYFLDVEAEPLP